MMGWSITAARILLGAVLVFGGIEGAYYTFTGNELVDTPETPQGHAFIQALETSGFFWQYMKGLQFIAGLLLLSNRYVPLALAIATPIVATIMVFHAAINHPGLHYGILATVPTAWLLFSYREHFRSLLAKK